MIKYSRRTAYINTISKLLLFFLIFSSAVHIGKAAESAEQKILVTEISGIIGAGTKEHILESLQRAEHENAQALVIVIDTPGGLYDATREIVGGILNSEIPVVSYVSPKGARAASAGSFILISSHVAAMSGGTSTGAAHPVISGLGKVQMSEEMKGKILSDAMSYMRTIAHLRNRNSSLAVAFVENSTSITETEALENGIIDLVSDSLDELLLKMDGKEIEVKGAKKVLKTEKAKIKKIEIKPRNKLLDALSNPNIAYILLAIAMYGIIFELSNPGAILPGVVGAVSLLLAFAGFSTISINMIAMLLILVGIIMFVLELKITSYGMLTLGGALSFILGSLMLVNPEREPFVAISGEVIFAITLLTAGFFAFAVRKTLEAQRKKPSTGREAMMGEIGVVEEELKPEGMIMVKGELWKARAMGDKKIEKGRKVKIVEVKELALAVEEIREEK